MESTRAPEAPPAATAAAAASSAVGARKVAVLSAIVGLAASSTLLAKEVVPSSGGLCTAGGGCDEVAQSTFAHVFGVPMAAIGVVAFACALVIAAAPGTWARRVRPWVALLAAVQGVRLLFLQLFVIHAICPFCVVADVAGLVLAGAVAVEAFAHSRLARSGGRRSPVSTPSWGHAVVPFRRGVVAALALVAVGGPMTVALVRASRPPSSTHVVTRAPVPSGSVASVGPVVLREFIDLECPYCRATHVALSRALAGRGDVVIERRHVPLPQHPHAMDAAVAACCADEQHAETPFIDAVVTSNAPPDIEHCRGVARSLGLDLAAFDACRASGRPEARVAADARFASAEGITALPTIEVAGERYTGALDEGRARALVAKHVR